MLFLVTMVLGIIKATIPSELSKLSKRSSCSKFKLKLAALEIGIEHDDYLQRLR